MKTRGVVRPLASAVLLAMTLLTAACGTITGAAVGAAGGAAIGAGTG
jgi:outer membrane lipoprotein SlyB